MELRQGSSMAEVVPKEGWGKARRQRSKAEFGAQDGQVTDCSSVLRFPLSN